MSQLTLLWREYGKERSYAFDLNRPNSNWAGIIRLGRDPNCDVVLHDPRISRVHAEITFNRSEGNFYIQNLRESNPILVDDQQLIQGSRLLQHGTIITVGETKIRVTNNEIASNPPVKTKIPVTNNEIASNPPVKAPSLAKGRSITSSLLLPIIVLRRRDRQTPYLILGILTVIWFFLLFISSVLHLNDYFNFLFATYLGCGGFYIIYQLCGKHKPWWVLSIPVLATPILLKSPVWDMILLVFRHILPGRVPPPPSTDFLSSLIAYFFGAGLAEELLKALPIFGLMWFSQKLNPAMRNKVGVTEPLDGIILGAASGLGFTLYETLHQYVPDNVERVSNLLGQGAGELFGLQVLIVRILASVFGHMAYSGYFGYYIGLSNLKPKRRWQFLGTGYLISAGTHALWDSSGLGTVIVGILAYCLLIGAIFKARQLSPTRASNSASSARSKENQKLHN